MTELQALRQELEDIKSFIDYYTEKNDKKELERWKIIKDYVLKKYARELAIQTSMNS